MGRETIGQAKTGRIDVTSMNFNAFHWMYLDCGR